MNQLMKKQGFQQFNNNLIVHRIIAFLKRDKYLLLLSLPGLIILLIFNYGPMFGVLAGFTKYNPVAGILGSEWVGTLNFERFIADPFFFRLVRNTFVLGICSIIFVFPAPIILALFLNEVRWSKFKKVTQTISYLPYFISMVVIVGLVKKIFTVDGGLINIIITQLGMEPVNFLMDFEWFRFLYIVSAIWQTTGYGAVIYLAALSGVDVEMYEAAIIDGANRLQMMLKITLPSILPTIAIMLIFSISGIMGSDFTKIFLLYSPATYETADVISTYVYRQAFQVANFGYSAAIGFMNSVVSAVFLVCGNYISKKLSEHSLW